MPSRPPSGDFTRERACTRLLGFNEDGSENVCHGPPVAHVMWALDSDGWDPGFVCAEHRKELGVRWSFVAIHDLGDACGMPGSLYFPVENECRFDGDLPTVEPVRAIARPLEAA